MQYKLQSLTQIKKSVNINVPNLSHLAEIKTKSKLRKQKK